VDAQSPNPVTIGSSATYLITVTRGVGSSGQFDATMSVTTSLPAGATYSFSGLNGQGALHFGNGANSMTTKLTITTTGATTANHTIAANFASNVAATSTTVGSSPSPSEYGTSVTFTATVTSGGSPVTVGALNFYEGSCSGSQIGADPAVDGNGQAHLSSSTL